jgi:small subunit ribosomal protein S6
MFIADPELEDDSTEALVERVKGYIEEGDGTPIKVDDWGLRRLAYTIENRREGRYYLVHFAMPTENVKELERRLLLADGIIRELIVRLEGDVEEAETTETASSE